MKIGLFSGILFAALVGALSFESKPWAETGKRPVFNALGTFGNSAFALPYPTPTPAGYTINSQPFGSNYGKPSHHSQPIGSHYSKPFDHATPCNLQITDQIILDYRHAIYNLTIPLFKKAAALSEGHFIFSPYTIWLTLAALAEGTSGPTQVQLFKLLQLPENDCLRQVYYHLATTREYSTSDIVLGRNRQFIADSSVHVNKKWEEYVKTHTHLETKLVPFKADPFVEIESLKKIYKVHLPNIDLSGNSIILESLDYHGLWTSAFSDAVIQEGPFYNNVGEQVGVVEYMKTSKRANIGYVPSINMKVLDLPVGKEGRYRMYFAVSVGKEDHVWTLDKIKPNLVIQAAMSLRQTDAPVEIVIPKFSMTSELDVKQLLEEVGIHSLWTDPAATRNISDPAALPSSFVQRVTVTIDNGGVRPSVQEYQNFVPAVPSFVAHGFGKPYAGYPTVPVNSYSGVHDYQNFEKSFIANKPFLFGLFDSETLTSMFSATFSKLNTY